MEPSLKKRRLAPRGNDGVDDDDLPYQQRFDSGYPAALMGDEPPSQSTPTKDTEFERFARNLQDAASFAQDHPEEPKFIYNGVKVLLLRWEDDLGVEDDLQALSKLFHDRYFYRTESWVMPSCSDPDVKLSMQIAKELNQIQPDQLLIIYYAGYAFMGSDDNLYWACNSRDDASRLKWDTIRTLLQDAQTDILLLLDACANPDVPATGNNGTKQAIAAYGRENVLQEHNGPTFTYNLIDALHNLSIGPPFTVTRLHEELVTLRHQRSMDNSTITNGNGQATVLAERNPVFFSLATRSPQSTISLAPLAPSPIETHIQPVVGDTQAFALAEDFLINGPPPELMFEDLRALVSLALMGEPSQEMDFFKSWLSSTPASGANVTVEGMFQGPPTIMILSMPIAVYNAIQADRVCSLLGYIKSHNMLGQHQSLLNIATSGAGQSYKDLEDGKILLEAREAAVTSPSLTRKSPQHLPPHSMVYPPVPMANMVDHDPVSGPRKDDVEDSDEMHEAAIQLKALSHVRPPGRSLSDHLEGSPNYRGLREGSPSSQALLDTAGAMLVDDWNTPPPIPRQKPRRSLQKNGPKQDTRCTMCSHAPFKDSSSLRKHVAAAHTRPFPCAFSFAGCTSTFGSKNEWKRHIASQHLCLTFYRCSSCPQSTMEGKGNEFNRKDLFTQHLRRMHAPFAIKKAIAKGDSKLQVEWEDHVKAMQASCLVIRRQPPQRSSCPNPTCSNIFEGVGSWDDWTEHVGRHMEKGEASRLGVDRLLAKWASDEGIIERREDGEYRLCGQERDSQAGGSYSDGPSRNQLEDGRMDDGSLMDQTIDNLLDDEQR